MATAYADLPKTPSGALTAVAKRTVAAERQAALEQAAADRARATVLQAAHLQLSRASDDYTNTPGALPHIAVTPREEQAEARGYRAGEKAGRGAWREESLDNTEEALAQQIHRIAVLGLDTELTVLEVLCNVRDTMSEAHLSGSDHRAPTGAAAE
jgi:hypothetical protein